MNNYEAANAIEMGEARVLILGPKPDDFITDDAGDLNKRQPVSDLDDE